MDPLSIASAGLQAGGSLLGGLFGLFSGNAQAKEYKAEARQAEQVGGVNAEIALQQGNETAARAATQAAANGGGLGGSAIGVVQQASNMAMFNARDQVYRGATQAQADLYDAKLAEDNGINSLIGGVVGAGGAGVTQGLDAQYRTQMLNAFSASHGEGVDPLYGLGPY